MSDGSFKLHNPSEASPPPESAVALAATSLSDADAAVVDALFSQGAAGGAWNVAALPPGSAERARKLTALLALLEHDTVEPPPADLTRRTLARVASYEQRSTLSQQVEMLREPRRTLGLHWGRFLSAAALFVVGFSLLLPTIDRTRDDARRVACAANLGLAGQAFSAYAADNAGVLPRREVQPGSEWWHVGQPNGERPGAAVRSNSAHLYLLYARDYASADALSCPANEHARPGDMSKRQDDWRNPRAVSFSYQNQYTTRAIRLDANPTLALLADKNPLFVIRVNRITFDDGTPALAPSRTHDSRGQNILLANGTVRWSVRPVIVRSTAGDDNVWVVPGVRRYTGTEIPATDADRVDSFLVP